MPDKKQPEHSKLADIERLRLNRYNTKGPGAARPTEKPTVDQLRSKVAKVAKKTKPKKNKRGKRRG